MAILLSASASIAAPPGPEPAIEIERIVRTYAYLKNAEQMATGGVAFSTDDLMTAGRAMTRGALKKECEASVDRTLAAISAGPASRRPETIAYLKAAMLRLTFDREEPHAGHVGWAIANPRKVSPYIRTVAKTVKDALAKL